MSLHVDDWHGLMQLSFHSFHTGMTLPASETQLSFLLAKAVFSVTTKQ